MPFEIRAPKGGEGNYGLSHLADLLFSQHHLEALTRVTEIERGPFVGQSSVTKFVRFKFCKLRMSRAEAFEAGFGSGNAAAERLLLVSLVETVTPHYGGRSDPALLIGFFKLCAKSDSFND